MAVILVSTVTANADGCPLGYLREERDGLTGLGLVQHFVLLSLDERCPSPVAGFIRFCPPKEFLAGRNNWQPHIEVIEATVVLLANAAWQESHRADSQSLATFTW